MSGMNMLYTIGMAKPAPKLSTIHDIGREAFVKGTHGLNESQYRSLLRHPETAKIFREHGVIGVKSVLYGLEKGQKETVRSLDQGRKIFKALMAIPKAPHAEEIRRSVGLGHKTAEQLMKEAARREGPSDADKKAHHEKMMLRAKADRRQQELYVQARANLRSTSAEKTSVGKDTREARTSVKNQEHTASVSDQPTQPDANPAAAGTDTSAAKPTHTPVELSALPSQLAAQASESPLASDSDTPLAPTQLEKPTAKPDDTDESDDVKLPPAADEGGLPL